MSKQLDVLRGRLQEELAQAERASQEATEAAKQSSVMERRLTKVVEVLYGLVRAKQLQVSASTEHLISQGLRVVLERDYDFTIDWSVQRSQIAATMNLTSPYGKKKVTTTILDARGGGVVDLVSFILRLVVASRMKPRLRRVLFLDEPFKHLSAVHAEGLGLLLQKIAKKLGWQIMFISQQREVSEHATLQYRARIVRGITKLRAV